jgi:histone-lysine N-methyltransferase SETMAR
MLTSGVVLLHENARPHTAAHSQKGIGETVKKLHREIQNKRHGMLTSGVVLHDNARPHTAAHSRALAEHFNWESFDHPPYSPDLAPSDYHLFTYLENFLRSQRFNNNDQSMEGFKT